MGKRPLSRVQQARARAAEVKRAEARAVRVQRAKDRGGLGPLRDRVVKPVTLKRYKACVKEFFKWCKQQGYKTPSSTEDFDGHFTAWAECLWSEGDPRTILGNGLAGIAHLVPSLRRRLNGTWRLYNAWGRLEPAKQAPPLTLLMTQALAGWYIQEKLLGAGLGILLAFNIILRTGELLELRKSDFTFGPDIMIIVLRDTKVGSRFGVLQETVCKDKWLVQKFKQYLKGLDMGDVIVQLSAANFRGMWRKASKACGIGPAYKPYSLRRGGATSLFRHTGKYDIVMERGRWLSVKSMKGYINQALQELATVDELDAKNHIWTRYADKLHLA